MKENHACMNFPLSLSTEGAPVYEQKELRKQQRALEERFPLKGRCAVRMARAERTADFTLIVQPAESAARRGFANGATSL